LGGVGERRDGDEDEGEEEPAAEDHVQRDYILLHAWAVSKKLLLLARPAATIDRVSEPDEGDGTVTIVRRDRARPGAGAACMVVIHGDDLGRRHGLSRPLTTIGRSQQSDVRVDQESVSRNHARVERVGENYVLRDLGSTNGTYLNDQAVQESALRNGDLVQIGRTIFKVLHGDSVESAYHEEVFRLSTTDGLTQVLNRRYFMEQLGRELARARRYHRPLGLILLDVDHFKQVNDEHGHLAGDHLLKQLAALLRGNLRQEDLIGRYGGEEFVVALPEIDGEGATRLAEKVRRLVQDARPRFEEDEIPVTVSVGVTALADDMDDAEALLRAADERVYQAKRDGRNRVCGAV
jgi:diguanylate cyclase (GGDEF)-like protein